MNTTLAETEFDGFVIAAATWRGCLTRITWTDATDHRGEIEVEPEGAWVNCGREMPGVTPALLRHLADRLEAGR